MGTRRSTLRSADLSGLRGRASASGKRGRARESVLRIQQAERDGKVKVPDNILDKASVQSALDATQEHFEASQSEAAGIVLETLRRVQQTTPYCQFIRNSIEPDQMNIMIRGVVFGTENLGLS